jgi:hypothetical protein
MRYFNVEQHREPKNMFSGERKVDISDLEKTAIEITEEQAHRKPNWGSGNLAVNEETGDFQFIRNNWDSSG